MSAPGPLPPSARPSAPPDVHRRVSGAAWARARHGALADRCFAGLGRADPPADALVAALAAAGGHAARFDLDGQWQAWRRDPGSVSEPAAALFASVWPLPGWVDWEELDGARSLFERAGVAGGLVLALRSLMSGYLAPEGNKPLVFSGRLQEQAPRRLAETTRFVAAVCAPEGLRPGAEGWRIALHVRLMHAEVRRLLWASGRWDAEAWAEPINQHDMLATMLLFSEVYVGGLELLGFAVDAAEADAWIALWRLAAWIMGSEEALLPASFAEAQALRSLIELSQRPVDDDGRALCAALIGRPVRLSVHLGPGALERPVTALRQGFVSSLSRRLLGADKARALAIPATPVWDRALAGVPPVVGALELLRQRSPTLEAELRRRGASYWRWIVEFGLAGEDATFERPQGLREL